MWGTSGATNSWSVIDEVRYDQNPPWPAEANGGGPSLQLIDPAEDNSRVGNWGREPDYAIHAGQSQLRHKRYADIRWNVRLGRQYRVIYKGGLSNAVWSVTGLDVNAHQAILCTNLVISGPANYFHKIRQLE